MSSTNHTSRQSNQSNSNGLVSSSSSPSLSNAAHHSSGPPASSTSAGGPTTSTSTTNFGSCGTAVNQSISCPSIGTSINAISSTISLIGSSPASPLSLNQILATRLATMYALRPQLCDVQLETEDGHVIDAHKIVLASALQYFNAMFTINFVESSQSRITLKKISGKSLEQIIKWCYTAAIDDLEPSNCQQLLSAAKMLDCVDLVNCCINFIKSQLDADNVLGIYEFASYESEPVLMNFALEYIHTHFMEISESSEFYSLSPDQLAHLISSDLINLGETGEVAVIKAIMNWINFCPDERKSSLSQLMKHVRLPLLTKEQLISIEDEFPLLKQDTQCKDLLIEAMKYHLASQNALDAAILTLERFRERSPRGHPKCLLVVGGQAPKAIRHCEYFDFSSEKWYDLPFELPSRRCRAGLAVLNGLVYAIGGFNGSLRVRTVDCFDPNQNQWISCPSMEARRSTLGVGVLNGLVFAVGGFDGSSGLQSAEVFNPVTQTWSFIAPMSTKRSSVGVGVLNNRLYAVGGYDGQSRQCLASVEYYDPETESWNLVANMSQRRSGAGVGVLDGKLYAIGGHDGPAVRKSVECYDPDSNQWHQVADMIIARRNAAVAIRDGQIYVIGGDDGQSNLSSIEIYNPKLNSWSLLTHQMTIGRSYAGAAILEKNWS